MSSAWNVCSSLCTFLLFTALVSAQPSPVFETWKDDPGTYHQPGYPLIFIASFRDAQIGNGGNFGTDVLEAGAPSRGQELWMLLSDGTTERLFPLAGVHDGLVDYPLGPTNGRINGSVTEPSVSINGRRVYFSYFHDALNFPPYCCGTTGHSNFDGWPLGGDLYAIDIGPKIDDPSFPTDQLRVSRLTQTTDWYADAMNPSVTSTTELHTGGVVHTGAIEVDTELGRQLVFASDRKQLRNSNQGQGKKNKNFNIFTARVADNGTSLRLVSIRQHQYYTTTSALSPNRLRVGYALSYQATTEEPRQWHIQEVRGSRWGPLYGYGIVAEAAHLASFCVKSNPGALPPGDYEVITQYYNANNNGMGFIAAQDMSQLGLNTYNNFSSAGVGYIPKQVGSYNLTPGVKKGDYPSSVGKFTAPACGGPDELYMTYDPGVSNHRNSPYPYHPRIVYTDLEPGNPANPGIYTPVIASTDPEWGALWAKPVIDWNYRLKGFPHPTGKARQQRPKSVTDKGSPISAGAPYAVFGTSSLANTDVKPVDCKDVHGYYNPYETGNTIDQIFKNIDSLSRVMVDAPGNINLQTGSCSKPTETDIFGIAIYLTSNKINNNHVKPGYSTGGSKMKESKRLLGTFQVGMNGESDSSFKAVVPANAPVDFHLLDRNGLKLADVRTWHSLKPRETRNDCGGCHNHRPGEAVPWSSSDSSDPDLAPLDMVTQTTHVSYDASCQPVLQTSTDAVLVPPVWQDLSADFHLYCGSCHAQNGGSTTANSLNALSYDPSKLNGQGTGSPVKEMLNKKYIDKFSANGSRLFWAAYGSRTDGRDNGRSQYQPSPPDYSACGSSGTNLTTCGYQFSSVHENLSLCDGSNPGAAAWVYRLGQWIDNHAPVNTGNNYDHGYDRYHPTVDGAFDGGPDFLHPQWFNIGYWDDSGGLSELAIDVNDTRWRTLTNPATLQNGTYAISLGQADMTPILGVRVKVTATDASGNTQRYEKSIAEVALECIAAGGRRPTVAEPTPNAKPIRSASRR